MANTIDAELIGKTLSAKAITVLSNKLAPLRAFSTDFSDDVVEAQGVVNVPVAASGSSTLTNPTDFESGDSTLNVAAVTMNHYSQPFHLTSKQLNSGNRLEQLAEVNLDALGDKIQSVIFGKITTASFGDSAVTGDATFGVDELKDVWAEIKGKRKNIILAPELYKEFLPSDRNSLTDKDGMYGFDVFDYVDSTTGLPANTTGFVCAKNALAVATAIPDSSHVSDLLTYQDVVTLPDLGISVQVNVWGSTSSRNVWCSYDVAAGAAKADGDALRIIKSV